MNSWTITLTEEERDNLLVVLALIGYPNGGIDPFHFMYGDWTNRVANKLTDADAPTLQQGLLPHFPVFSEGALKQAIQSWSRKHYEDGKQAGIQATLNNIPVTQPAVDSNE